MPPPITHTCAGGVLYDPATKKVALIQFEDDGLHALPKGHTNPGETPEQTALREVQEETGFVNIRIVCELGVLDFTYTHWQRKHEQHRKTVHHFLFEVIGNERDHTLRDADETHSVVWLTFDEAKRKIPYANARELLEKAEVILRNKEMKR